MKSFIRLLLLALVTSSLMVLVYACSPGSGGSADGGKTGGDAAKTDAALACSSVCAAKATMCGLNATQADGPCATFCETMPSQSMLACVTKASCTTIEDSFTGAKPLCPTPTDASTSADGKSDVKIPDTKLDASKGDGASADGHASDDATSSEGGGDGGMKHDATMQDAPMNDGMGPDSMMDANPGTCTISLSSGESYTCTALASYSPANGTLFTLDSNESANGVPYFEFGVTLSSSKDFMAGASYSEPDGTATHVDGQAVWDYSSAMGDGTATVTVTSSGYQWMDDGGSGDIYYAQAYGDAVIVLAPKDPPFATSPVTATIHWVTPGGGSRDGGMDASHDGSADGSKDGSKDGNMSGSIKCTISVTGGAAEPCSSTLTYYSTFNPPYSILQINPKSDGGDSTTITLQFPGQASGLAGPDTSANCVDTALCNAAVAITQGSGSSEKGWARKNVASDIGSATPWYSLDFTTFGNCYPTPVVAEPCTGWIANLTMNAIPTDMDAGGAPQTVTLTNF